MPTPPMSDEELDELVRRSAEAYPEELPLGNWLRMEAKLQEEATTQLVRQRLWRFFGLEVGVVALLLLLWQGYRALTPTAIVHPERASRAVRGVGSPPVAAPARNTHTPSASTWSVATTQPALLAPEPLAPKEPTKKLTLRQSATTTATAAAAPRRLPEPRPTRTATSGVVVAALLDLPHQRIARTRANEHNLLTASTQHKLTNEPLQQGASTPNAGFEDASTALTFLPDQLPATGPVLEPLALQMPGLAQEFELPTTLPVASQRDWLATFGAPTSPTDSMAHLKPAGYRLVAGVIGAPAWTAVRTLTTAQLGGNVGVTLEYQLTRQLRVRTGLVRSVKRYEAASSDYTPLPAWGWRPGNYEVYASCRVTEIPLDLRYDVVQHPTYTVFAGVGLTSLLMRNERYAYDYQANGQTHTVGAKVVNGSNYAFGLLNLSGGVERAFGSRWSGQVEPFVQLPLGSVGAGKVRLSSAGLSFSLKYGLLR